MANKLLRLSPFTNFSFILNPSFRTSITENGTWDQGSSSFRNHGNVMPTVSTTSFLTIDSNPDSCHVWQDAQHTLFQFANLCAAVSLLTPSSFRHHLLFLRCLLLIDYFLLAIWAGLLVCMLDVLLWNCVFFIVDCIHIACLAYTNIAVRLSPSLNELFCKKIKPLRVCRREFAELCNLGSILPLRKGCRYCVENHTPCGVKVSILLQGRLKVTHDGIFLHSVEPNEFVDSPEFDSVLGQSLETCQRYQVTISAVEESLVISWLYLSIKSHLSTHSCLATVFRNIIGKDISDKLYRIQEMLQRADHGDIPDSFLSSTTSVPKCLSPLDPRAHFDNAPGSVWESDFSLNSQQAVTVTVETSV